MEKLGQIAIDNSLNVNLNCQVDQSLLAKNFVTIVDALKELQKAQQLSNQRINDFSSLKDRLDHLSERVETIDKNSSSRQKDANSSSNGPATSNQHQQLSSTLAALTKRVDKSQTNILDNIKDINLLNSDLRDAKTQIEELKKKLSLIGASSESSSKESANGYGIHEIADNLNNELKKTEQNMRTIFERLGVAQENIQRLDEELKSLKKRNAESSGSGNSGNNIGVSDQQFEDLKNGLRDKLDVINKKINMLQTDSNGHTKQIAELREQLEERQGQTENAQNSSNNGVNQSVSADILKLKKRLDELDSRERKDVKQLHEQLDNLKQQLKALRAQKIESKTSLEDENPRSNRKLTINRDRDDLQDKVNDLIMKVNYLEKLLSGSKNSLGDEKNPEKLPSIHRPKKRDPNITGFYDKEKSGIGRKDLAELKAELQAWLKGLLDSLQNRQNFQTLELKIQELRKNLDKKADAEGTRKGFTFLENKITQLYLFLTEPESEDAMIVRKGFSCLSCSKKIEKLRGKLGPRINWNNMTSTNYTPPKVGYSKPMGDRSLDKEDDL